MTVFRLIIPALWLVLIAYWAISAVFAKRNVQTTAWWKLIAMRIGVVALVIYAVHDPHVRLVLRNAQNWQASSMSLGAVGTALVALGVGLAIHARVHLGRNWGMPMSRKEDPELVTDGPYALVRHPIYGGIILAMLGTAIAESLLWILPLIVFSAYFIYSAHHEEKLMRRQFPGRYSAYMKRTRMLLPLLF
ncbi:MAG: isoprenylcysteine carboxylmethyltransferase family protein [Bradyrhizobium sp.]|uniref:methyltransferase family protein n=1 Tax=Bradyrhizobium sp. TaxID=376 RepID=UPI001DC0FD5C|nr:isoprenylcysteine carboxylmethyltransferase family protein [Bradyrhizobium sp.]MBV9560729.1 isoprenylcysteine carboxylmethyltransferase family protein [Bradyrhizobium sp.]